MQPKDWNKIEKLLENTADQETLDAVKALVENMETSLNGSLTANVVKGIQFQKASFNISEKEYTFTISEVNPDKTAVLIDDFINLSGYCGFYLLEKTATKVTVRNSSGYSSTGYISIQVIEFY